MAVRELRFGPLHGIVREVDCPRCKSRLEYHLADVERVVSDGEYLFDGIECANKQCKEMINLGRTSPS